VHGPRAVGRGTGAYLYRVTTVDELKALLGPFPEACDLRSETLERVDCGSFWREKVTYYTEVDDQVHAYVCIPKSLTEPAPAIFCHHQHDDNFRLGKSEVVRLAGDPDQAYAVELAERGFITFAPDAITFEERTFGEGVNGEEYFELTARLVQGRTLMAKVLHDVSAGLDISNFGQKWPLGGWVSSVTLMVAVWRCGSRRLTGASRSRCRTVAAYRIGCR